MFLKWALIIFKMSNPTLSKVMIKSISIALFFLSLISFSGFSQEVLPKFKKDFEWKGKEDLPRLHDIPRLNQGDSIIFLDPNLERELNFPGLDGQKFSLKTEGNKFFPGEPPIIYNMPIQKPEGEFPILIHVPDDKVNYTIRIKPIGD